MKAGSNHTLTRAASVQFQSFLNTKLVFLLCHELFIEASLPVSQQKMVKFHRPPLRRRHSGGHWTSASTSCRFILIWIICCIYTILLMELMTKPNSQSSCWMESASAQFMWSNFLRGRRSHVSLQPAGPRCAFYCEVLHDSSCGYFCQWASISARVAHWFIQILVQSGTLLHRIRLILNLLTPIIDCCSYVMTSIVDIGTHVLALLNKLNWGRQWWQSASGDIGTWFYSASDKILTLLIMMRVPLPHPNYQFCVALPLEAAFPLLLTSIILYINLSCCLHDTKFCISLFARDLHHGATSTVGIIHIIYFLPISCGPPLQRYLHCWLTLCMRIVRGLPIMELSPPLAL